MPAKKLLDGLKVLDFSWMVAGPFVTKYLADHGAMVIKIETSRRPDIMRSFQPYKDGIGGVNRSGVWAAMNAGKYSMALNMGRPEALDVARRLTAWADIVIENFAPGVMAAWGLGYEALSQINPQVIMLSMSSMGQTGPFAHYHGLGFHLQAFAGFNQVTGFPDREPFGSIPYTDFVGPTFAITALMGALDYRRRTAKGTYIDMSQVEASIHFLAPAVLDYSANGREPRRCGNLSRFAAPHAAYRCKGDDQWCVISVFTDAQWRGLCKALRNPDWSMDPRYKTLGGRRGHREELDGRLEAWALQHAPEEIMELLQAAGVPAGVVQDGRALAEDPHLRERSFYQQFDHPEIGPSTTRRSPVLYSDADASAARPAPLLGQDTEHICTRVLGMSDEEWLALVNCGALT